MQESKFYPILYRNLIALFNFNGTLINFTTEIFLYKF